MSTIKSAIVSTAVWLHFQIDTLHMDVQDGPQELGVRISHQFESLYETESSVFSVSSSTIPRAALVGPFWGSAQSQANYYD